MTAVTATATRRPSGPTSASSAPSSGTASTPSCSSSRCRARMEKIVDKLIAELAAQLEPKAVRLDLTPAARRLLAERGYDPIFGARPLGRLIEEAVKRPLTQELLFGALHDGGHALIDVTLPAAV